MSEYAMQGKAIPKLLVTLNPNAVGKKELPLGGDSLNFAVMRKDGTSSNAWGVKVNRNNGGAFVYCRDNMNVVKASLHQSGDHRYGIRHEKYNGLVESGLLEPGADRTWIRWIEPPTSGPGLIPSFNIYFPSWGIALTEEMRKINRDDWNAKQIWDSNQICIEGVDSPFILVVSFIKADDNISISLVEQDNTAGLVLGILPAGPGKTLWVTVQVGPEGDLRQIVERGLDRMSEIVAEKFTESHEGEIFAVCFNGFNDKGIAYALPVPVEVKRR